MTNAQIQAVKALIHVAISAMDLIDVSVEQKDWKRSGKSIVNTITLVKLATELDELKMHKYTIQEMGDM